MNKAVTEATNPQPQIEIWKIWKNEHELMVPVLVSDYKLYTELRRLTFGKVNDQESGIYAAIQRHT